MCLAMYNGMGTDREERMGHYAEGGLVYSQDGKWAPDQLHIRQE